MKSSPAAELEIELGATEDPVIKLEVFEGRRLEELERRLAKLEVSLPELPRLSDPVTRLEMVDCNCPRFQILLGSRDLIFAEYFSLQILLGSIHLIFAEYFSL